MRNILWTVIVFAIVKSLYNYKIECPLFVYLFHDIVFYLYGKSVSLANCQHYKLSIGNKTFFNYANVKTNTNLLHLDLNRVQL